MDVNLQLLLREYIQSPDNTLAHQIANAVIKATPVEDRSAIIKNLIIEAALDEVDENHRPIDLAEVEAINEHLSFQGLVAVRLDGHINTAIQGLVIEFRDINWCF